MIVLTGVQVEKSHTEILHKKVETIIGLFLLMDGESPLTKDVAKLRYCYQAVS